MKKIFAIVLVILLMTRLAGCYVEPAQGDLFDSGGRFTVVEHNTCNDSTKYYSFTLVDEETGVLYVLIHTNQHKMAMTVLLNADGTPMTLEEYKTCKHYAKDQSDMPCDE